MSPHCGLPRTSATGGPQTPRLAPSGNLAPLVPWSPQRRWPSPNSLPPRRHRPRGEHSPSVATAPASKSRQSPRPLASSNTLLGPVGSSLASSRSPLLRAMDADRRGEPGAGSREPGAGAHPRARGLQEFHFAPGSGATGSSPASSSSNDRAPPRCAGQVRWRRRPAAPPSGEAGACAPRREPGQRGPRPAS